MTAAGPVGAPQEGAGRETWLTRPGLVLTAVVAAWTVVPSLVVNPALTWALTAALLVLVANALVWHAHRVRWTAPPVLLALLLACTAVSTVHHGTLGVLALSTATALLLVGCGLLAAHATARETTVLARGVVLLALVQLAVAQLGVEPPWGYAGSATSFADNDLAPALGARATGTMAHPIPFGTLLAVGAALALSRAVRWPPAVRFAAAAACGYGVALSGSRSAVLALALALVVAALAPGALRIGWAGRTAAVLGLLLTLLLVDIPRLPLFTSLQGTGSLTHRLAALDAAVRLAGRPPEQVLLGSGAGSLRPLFEQGLLQLDGFFAVDNQLVTTFAEAGLVGVLALVVAAAIGLRRGDRATRPAALLVVLMFASFDVLEWNAAAFLGTVLLLLGTAERPAVPDPERTAPPARALVHP